ncbi:hypothetical protein G4G27_06900 [Sphingomonas sp. So64.6b]|uniref:hypothetical protein n=1 Tax=Sphingomonas sp. So64.6b TaxID=2997354 RepID=UPI00160073AE|nr:hypothetical protein [Sphingomonas sp. So64.6b]QNA83747.1 hypothetical protein G4G27_06900 [Sphingomonas sp. So64.6b]
MTEKALLKSAQRLTRMLGITPSVAMTVVNHSPGQPGQITFLVLRHNSYQMPRVPSRFEGNIVRIKIDGVAREQSGPRMQGH